MMRKLPWGLRLLILVVVTPPILAFYTVGAFFEGLAGRMRR